MMLIATDAKPTHVIVDPKRYLPRLWATAWSLVLGGQKLAYNTHMRSLAHLDAFYLFCDDQFGLDALDEALSTCNAVATQVMTEAFYVSLTVDVQFSTGVVRRWEVVSRFVRGLANRHAPHSQAWSGISSLIAGMGKLRAPKHGRINFIRALPANTLADLLAVAEPAASRNPFREESVRWRNWFIVNLLLLCGLRRGEAMLLAVDALKNDVDRTTGDIVHAPHMHHEINGASATNTPSRVVELRPGDEQLPVRTRRGYMYPAGGGGLQWFERLVLLHEIRQHAQDMQRIKASQSDQVDYNLVSWRC